MTHCGLLVSLARHYASELAGREEQSLPSIAIGHGESHHLDEAHQSCQRLQDWLA